MKTQFGIAVACVVASAAQAQPFIVAEDYLSAYNLITFGNLTTTSEVEGRTLVGGNLFGNASNYGVALPNSTGVDVLAVAGNISGSNIQINNGGNLRLGGTSSANLNFNGGGQLINDPSVSQLVGEAQIALTGYSTFLTTQAPTNAVNIPGGNDQPGPVNFSAVAAGPNNVAVFNIDGNSLFNNNKVQQIDMNFNGADTVVINVSGTNITYNSGNFVGLFASDFSAQRVIWNFYEATGLQLDRVLWGAVLAPNANITGIGGNPMNQVIEGSVVANSLLTNSEVHLPTFDGFVPTPGTAAVLGLASLVAARRRRA
jgi:choice-of-anchor A domain-containing protein